MRYLLLIMENEELNIEEGGKMVKNVTGFFEHLKTYVSYYIAATTVIGGLWGAFVIYDNWRDNNKFLHDSVKIIIETQAQQSRRDSIFLENQREIRIELDQVRCNTELSIDKIIALQKSYIKYISDDNALTAKQFLEYMEGLSIESKKTSDGS